MDNKAKRKYLKVPTEPVGWYRILCVEGDPYISTSVKTARTFTIIQNGCQFRLAVKLGLIVDTNGMHTRVSFPFGEALAFETRDKEPYAATRLAIVRAAARIGRTL